MGDAKRRRAAFFAKHPRCCFCGGERPATQEDHVPPRSMFRGRNWPEGYVFPACADCNNGSTIQDRLFAFVASMPAPSDQPIDEQHRREWLAIAREVRKDNPAVFAALIPSANEKRRAAAALGLRPEPGQAIGEIGILRMNDEVTDAFTFVATKLGKALHYLHTGRIVPADGEVRVFLYSNGDIRAGRFPVEMLHDLPVTAELVRSNRDLGEQFVYRFGAVADHGIYVCMFGKAHIAALVVHCEPPPADWYEQEHNDGSVAGTDENSFAPQGADR